MIQWYVWLYCFTNDIFPTWKLNTIQIAMTLKICTFDPKMRFGCLRFFFISSCLFTKQTWSSQPHFGLTNNMGSNMHMCKVITIWIGNWEQKEWFHSQMTTFPLYYLQILYYAYTAILHIEFILSWSRCKVTIFSQSCVPLYVSLQLFNNDYC